MNSNTYDIAIVGGGLVGASMALALAPLPLSVALIDKVAPSVQTQIDYDARALALSHSSCQIYETLGIISHIKNCAAAIQSVHVSDQGYWGSVRITAEELGVAALGQVIAIPNLLSVLSTALENITGLERYAPAGLESFHEIDDAWQLTLDTGQSLQARLVIAADGMHSPIRKQLALPTRSVDYEQWALIANVSMNRPHQRVAYERFTPKGPLALLPLQNEYEMTLVCAIPCEQEAFFNGLSDAAFLSLLQRWFGYRLGKFERIGRREKFPLRLLQATEQYRPGIVTIGNAAHHLHPIAAQGFNLGLRDVAFLAEIFADALAANQDIKSEALLQRYWQLRQADQQKTIRFSHGLLSLFSNDFLPFKWARHVGMLGLEFMPQAKKLFAEYGMGSRRYSSKLARGVRLDD